jgi:hypothetical protein
MALDGGDVDLRALGGGDLGCLLVTYAVAVAQLRAALSAGGLPRPSNTHAGRRGDRTGPPSRPAGRTMVSGSGNPAWTYPPWSSSLTSTPNSPTPRRLYVRPAGIEPAAKCLEARTGATLCMARS